MDNGNPIAFQRVSFKITTNVLLITANQLYSREQVSDNGKPFTDNGNPITVQRAIILQTVNRLCEKDNQYIWTRFWSDNSNMIS